MLVTVTADLRDEILSRSKAERQAIGEAITTVRDSWGNPHMHAGVGIRKLLKNTFECRVGLSDRLIFLVEVNPAELVFYFMGNHNEVQKLLNHPRKRTR